MKLSKIAQPVIDLSDAPSVSMISKLRKNDLVIYEGMEWRVEFAPKKTAKNVWWIGLSSGENKKYIRVVEDTKPKMTAHEKKTMMNNIKGVVKMHSESPRIITIAREYYANLSVHNNYDEKDVRDCMKHFPVEALKKAGIAL